MAAGRRVSFHEPIDEQTADELRDLRKRQESLPDGKPAATPDESSFLGVGLVPAQEGGDSTYGYIPSSVFAFTICAVVLIFATILVGILMTKMSNEITLVQKNVDKKP
ncbi:hypothetical protein IscW_ISCW023675 [Ixodes scapularis]|uniref:Uncharacterized protein n=1 Tax=Ixodes scapularis TaxID=6945 RepID=B7QM27_IXOSC|nr:hypothetical protein IscW_ISCW023675 [Ixodes scapularis]|eukprot:XP_002416232.1 hypothetical protein IscW_ISCW023675 [Ixodes scapularis]